MENSLDTTSKRISDIHLSGNGEEELSEENQERYNELIIRAKRLVGEGRIEDALQVNKKALSICYTQKLAKKIKKIEDYLKAHADDSEEEEEDCGSVHMGKGFYIYKDLYNSLYSHQQEGVLWLWDLYRRKKGGILGDDMGLGKTIQVIGFLSGMFDMQKIKCVLIVLPVAVMVNWEKEFQKWAPGLKIMAYHGNSKSEKERALARIQRRGGVLLTTYGLVVTSWEQLGTHDGREFVWDYMILDEGHKIKNPTKTSKGVHAIPAHNRIILTGTPVQNNLKELWSLFDFVHQGTLLGTQKTFKMQYETPIITAREKCCTMKEKILGMEMAESLKKIIAPYFLRRTKAEVKQRESEAKQEPDPTTTHAVMPTMTRKNDLIVWTYLRDAQLQIYSDFISLDHVKELLMAKKSPLVALLVLKKICDHPRLLSTRACAQLGIEDENLDEDILETEEGSQSAVTRIQHIADDVLINESGKLLFLVKLLDRLKQEGHRCLVFSQSRKMLDIMEKVIANRGHKIMRLDGTIRHVQEREQRIQKFQTDDTYSVFLLTTQVGGVGLTLTAADRVVIFDPSWNPATDAQAVDRVFRIGQDKNVVIYRLITCGTVEEKIYRRQIFKDSITRQTTGNAKNPYRYFSKQELRELFVLDDPHSSTTQQQLEQMHSGQRLTDPSLDEHIAYLYSLDMYGLSDHDLMFSHGNEGGDLQDEELNDEESDHNIKWTVQKAQEIIEMESNQVCSLEERHGLSRPSQQQGVGGERARNQFSNWDFPKPGMTEQKEDEESEPEEEQEKVESSYEDIKPEVNSSADTIDLTSPVKDVPQSSYANIVVIKRNGSDGAVFPLTSTTCVFGSGNHCDIRVQTPEVGHEHCRLEVNKKGQIFMVGLIKSHPLEVNRKLVTGTVQLHHNDVFTMCQRSFRIDMPGRSRKIDTKIKEETIDLTQTPFVKPEPLVKQEPGVNLTPIKIKHEPMDYHTPNTPGAQEVHDLTMDTPKSNRKLKASTDSIEEPMDIGTPKRQPLKQNLTNGNTSVIESPAKVIQSITNTPGSVKTRTPQSSKRDRSIIHEQILISPDPARPLVETRSSNVGNQSLANPIGFKPKFNSTSLFGSVDSPDIINQSNHSGNDSVSSRISNSSRSSQQRKPFQALVEDSPEKSSSSLRRLKNLSAKSSSEDDDDLSLNEDVEARVNDSVIIDNSVVISDGEEKENISLGNISAKDIENILQKSLLNKTSDRINESFHDSPIQTKSRRRSTACKRRVIESSDEENDITENHDHENESVNNNADEGDESIFEEEQGSENEEDQNNDEMENEESSVNDGEDADDGVETSVNNSKNFGNDSEQDEAELKKVKDLRMREDSLRSEHGEQTNNRNDDNSVGSDNDGGDESGADVGHEEYVEEEQEDEGGSDAEAEEDDNAAAADDDDDAGDENEEEMSEEETGFESLPETEQIRYNELVEAGRIYCQNKQYEDGQACVLQALEIFPDEELQQTAMIIQQKIVRKQMRAQRHEM